MGSHVLQKVLAKRERNEGEGGVEVLLPCLMPVLGETSCSVLPWVLESHLYHSP